CDDQLVSLSKNVFMYFFYMALTATQAKRYDEIVEEKKKEGVGCVQGPEMSRNIFKLFIASIICSGAKNCHEKCISCVMSPVQRQTNRGGRCSKTKGITRTLVKHHVLKMCTFFVLCIFYTV
uniref:Uncharacterized protein n=1 Tax=Poecilia reticulata TaxID=8081 RepID=A0A3P9QEU0_POERE